MWKGGLEGYEASITYNALQAGSRGMALDSVTQNMGNIGRDDCDVATN